jgi:hypothetical protein
MQPPIDVSLHALNPKTALSLLGMGVLPLLVVFAVIFVMGGGRPPKGVTLTVLLVGGLVTVVGIWQLASVRLRVDAESLTVGGGFYKVSVPLDRLAADGVRAERVQTYALGARTNGIGMPGLRLGWFDHRDSGKAFVAITEPAKVVRINTREGYTILISADEPDALKERLSRH